MLSKANFNGENGGRKRAREIARKKQEGQGRIRKHKHSRIPPHIPKGDDNNNRK